MRVLGFVFICCFVPIQAVIHLQLQSKSYARELHIKTPVATRFHHWTPDLILQATTTTQEIGTLGHIPLKNIQEFQFIGSIGVGTPEQKLQVCFDTGSSDFWVPSTKCLTCAGTNRFTPRESTSFSWNELSTLSVAGPTTRRPAFVLPYGSGNAVGQMGYDRVTLDGFAIADVSIGLVFSEDQGLLNMQGDGLFGLAFDALSSITHPPVFTLLQRQHPDILPRFAFYLSPTPNSKGSELTIGGLNPAHVTPSTEFFVMPISKDGDNYTFWQTIMSRIKIGKLAFTDCTAVIDTGTSLLGIPQDLYMPVINHVARESGCFCGLTLYGFQCFTCHQDAFPLLRIELSQKPVQYFEIPSQDYVQCVQGTCVVLLQPTAVGQWILGDVFLKNVYTYFDLKSKTMGFACDLKNSTTCGKTHETLPSVNMVTNVKEGSTGVMSYLSKGIMWGCSLFSFICCGLLMLSLTRVSHLKSPTFLRLLYWLAIWTIVENCNIWRIELGYQTLSHFPTHWTFASLLLLYIGCCIEFVGRLNWPSYASSRVRKAASNPLGLMGLAFFLTLAFEVSPLENWHFDLAIGITLRAIVLTVVIVEVSKCLYRSTLIQDVLVSSSDPVFQCLIAIVAVFVICCCWGFLNCLFTVSTATNHEMNQLLESVQGISSYCVYRALQVEAYLIRESALVCQGHELEQLLPTKSTRALSNEPQKELNEL